MANALRVNGFEISLVFTRNRGGSDEILFPGPEAEHDVASELGATKLHWFRQKQLEMKREIDRLELEKLRKIREKKRKEKMRQKLFPKKKAGRK